MMNRYLTYKFLFVFCLLISGMSSIEAQEYLNTQAKVDAFDQSRTTISNTLIIAGSDIVNLDALSNITTVTGIMTIKDNPSLVNIDGLNNINSIAGIFEIRDNYVLPDISLEGLSSMSGECFILRNDNLTEISGFNSLTNISGEFILEDNQDLINISGFNNLTDISGSLSISSNISLTNIDALSNLTDISGSFSLGGNISLTNIDALSNLTDISGSFSLGGNSSLINIDGLNSITNLSGSLYIRGNSLLTTIDLESVERIEGDLEIENNNELIDISGFDNLQYLSGRIEIRDNERLTNIEGFNNLRSISGSFRVHYNDLLNNISAFNGLENISGFFNILYNDQLININGLDNLEDLSGYFHIAHNDELTNFNGLNNLYDFSGQIILQGNNSLENINALKNLTKLSGSLSIGKTWVGASPGDFAITNIDFLCNLTEFSGWLNLRALANLTNIDGLSGLTEFIGYLDITGNPNLTNIDALTGLTNASGTMKIRDNESLGDCCGLLPLLLNDEASVNITISSNNTGCNSQSEIFDSDCGLHLIHDFNPPCIGADNGSIQIQALRYDTIPFHYSWEHQESGTTGMDTTYESSYAIEGLIEGTYSVLLTQPNGDSAVIEDIVLDPILGSLFEVVELNTTQSVNGLPTGNIDIEYEGGQAPYNINWSGPSSGSQNNVAIDSFEILNILPGDYVITITDADNAELTFSVTLLDETIVDVRCEVPMDIVVLNLVSSSINANEYSESKIFFNEFFETINLGESDEDSRASIMEWSGNSQQELRIPITGILENLSSYEDLERSYSDGTNILAALQEGSEYLRQNARPYAQKVIIFTFDGCPPWAASAYAEELKEEGFIIADIGIDYVNESSRYQSLMRQAASLPELALFGQNFDEVDPLLLYSRMSYLFCEGSTEVAYFQRDGSISIDNIDTEDACPYPSTIEVTFTVASQLQLSIPVGTPVTFYHNDPTLYGANAISTFIMPCSIPAGSWETFTTSIPSERATQLYAVLNDDGLTPPAFELPVTNINESQYSNNVASKQICVFGATVQAMKSSTSLSPICEGIAQYTIDVCNISNDDAVGVVIEDESAPGFVLLSTKVNNNGCSTEVDGAYDIPAGCCVSLTLDYDVTSALDGYYGYQNVNLSGPEGQTYIDFDGDNTTAEDVLLDGTVNCGSNIVIFTKEVDNETTCEDHSLRYTYTIDNQTSNSLIGLEFSDILPAPLEWVYKPYEKEGISITTSMIEGQSATFMIDEIQAETTASFVIDVYVGATDVDVLASNSATISGVPSYVNDGTQVLISDAPMTNLLATTEIELMDTIFISPMQNELSLESDVSGVPGIVWTTTGDGTFSDPNTANPIYQMGPEDAVDTLLTLFVEVSTFCGQKGKSVVIKRDCDIELIDELLGYCIEGNEGADAIIEWNGGLGPYRLNGQVLDQSIASPYTLENIAPGNYTIELKDTLGCEDVLELIIADEGPEAVTETICINSETYEIEIKTGDHEVISDNGYEVEWIGDSTYQIINIDINTALEIIITDQITGCETIIEVMPPVCTTATHDQDQSQREKELIVPNIIALQSGGNNIFYPTLREPNQLITTMQIYDRFGKLMFSNENFAPNKQSEGWDGTLNGNSIKSGVYMYLIQTKDKVYTGDVTVIK